MIDYGINALVEVLREQPTLHDLLIDKLAREYGLSALKDLELFIMAEREDWNGKNTIEKYLENKIAKIEKTEDDIIEQRGLDILFKKKQIKWFYPLLICTIVFGSASLFSIWINFSNKEESRKKMQDMSIEIKKLQDTISFLFPSKKVYPKNTSTLSTQTDTTR